MQTKKQIIRHANTNRISEGKSTPTFRKEANRFLPFISTRTDRIGRNRHPNPQFSI